MSAHEEFWDLLCDYAAYFRVMLAGVAVMAVLNLAAMALGDQSTGAFVVSLLVFAVLGVTAAGLAGVLWRCNRR